MPEAEKAADAYLQAMALLEQARGLLQCDGVLRTLLSLDAICCFGDSQGKQAEAKQSLLRARALCPRDQGLALRKIDKALSLI